MICKSKCDRTLFPHTHMYISFMKVNLCHQMIIKVLQFCSLFSLQWLSSYEHNSLWNTCLFWLILRSAPNHTPLKYRWPIKRSNRKMSTYIMWPYCGIFNYTIQFYVVLAMDSSHLIRDSKQKTSSGPNLIEQIHIWLMHSLVCTQEQTPKNKVFICIPKIMKKMIMVTIWNFYHKLSLIARFTF